MAWRRTHGSLMNIMIKLTIQLLFFHQYSLTLRHTVVSHPASTIGTIVTDNFSISTFRRRGGMTWRRTCRSQINVEDLMINFLTSLQPILTNLQACSSLPPNIHGLTHCHRQLLHQHIERELVYDKKEDTWFLYKYCSLKMSCFYFSVTITPLPSGTQVFPIQHPPLVPMSQTVNPSSH